jgi:DNA-binding Lrp family transcriptional regulator
MFTKPQDVLVALRLVLDARDISYAELGKELGMSPSEVHAAIRRLREARLVEPDTRRVRMESLRNFLIHGVPYVFPARPGELTRGLPTAWAAPALSDKIDASGQVPPVWPDPDGTVQGSSIRPLYPSVPGAARRMPELYDLLALVDALRAGRARERAVAEAGIDERFERYAAA